VPSASALPSPVTGHVYLDDNTAGSNTIAAFDRHADGSLTPLPGSPFAAGGVGGDGFEAHLAHCPDCPEYLAQMRAIVALAGRVTPDAAMATGGCG
jgi:hypothetical protein